MDVELTKLFFLKLKFINEIFFPSRLLHAYNTIMIPLIIFFNYQLKKLINPTIISVC